MSHPSTIRIVVCGGIGSGKSAVGRALRRRGAWVIDADSVGHRVLQEVAPAVAARWPDVVVNGVVDRGLLGSIVFADPVQLHELEGLTQPEIAARIEREASGRRGVVAVELPVLGLLGDDWIRVVVDAPLDVRRERLRERGMADSEIDQRLAVQPEREAWLERADFVVDNAAGFRHLEEEVDRLWRWLSRDDRASRGESRSPGGP